MARKTMKKFLVAALSATAAVCLSLTSAAGFASVKSDVAADRVVVAAMFADETLTSYINDKVAAAETLYGKLWAPKYNPDTVASKLSSADFAAATDKIKAAKSKDEANVAYIDFCEKYAAVPTAMAEKEEEIRALVYKVTDEATNATVPYPTYLSADNTAEKNAEITARVAKIVADSSSALSAYKNYDEALKDSFDNAHAEAIRAMLVNVGKAAVKNVTYNHGDEFGKAAKEKISLNEKYALKLISETDFYGSGTDKDVAGYIAAYDASFTESGAIKYSSGDKTFTSSVPEANVSSVSFKDDNFEVTVTSVAADGSSVKGISYDSKLSVVFNKSFVLKINANNALKNPDKTFASDLAGREALVESLKGAKVAQTFTVTLTEDGIVTTEYKCKYVVSVKFVGNDKMSQFEGKLGAVSYNHNSIVGAVAKDGVKYENGAFVFTVDRLGDWALAGSGVSGGGIFAVLTWIIFIAVIILTVVLAVLFKKKDKAYNIKFNANGGKSDKVVKAAIGESFALPDDPKKDGNAFMGWYADKNLSERFTETALKKKGDREVFAKWMPAGEAAKAQQGNAAINSINAQNDERLLKEQQKLEKIQAEKAEYDAKAAEENRRAEEAKLEAVKKIEDSKRLELQKAQAERDAQSAKARAEADAAERQRLIDEAREDERQKAENKFNILAIGAGKDDKAKYESEIAALKSEKEAAIKENEELRNSLKTLPVYVKEPEQPAFSCGDAFDTLKAMMKSYKNSSDLPYGLKEKTAICSMKEADGKIILELNVPYEDMIAKGYKVEQGENATLYIIDSDEKYDEADELIEEAMMFNGMTQAETAAKESSDETERKDGYVFSAECRACQNAQELYKILRVYCKSFVRIGGEKSEEGERNVLKLFVMGGKVYICFADKIEGTVEAEAELAAMGYNGMIVVTDAESALKAEEVIGKALKDMGLVRYSGSVSLDADEVNEEKGFTYSV